MEAKFGPLEKKDKKLLTSMDMKFCPFLSPQKEWRNFVKVESRTGWREIKKMQIKLVTCDKNEQQDAKDNAKL